MHKFKDNVSEGWLFRQELRFFKNFQRNFDGDVDDCDFFDIFGNGSNTGCKEAHGMLKRFFTPDELGQFGDVVVSRESDEGAEREGRRVRPRRPLPDFDFDENEEFAADGFAFRFGAITSLLQDIWNKNNLRQRCREMLSAWCDSMERRMSSRKRRKDPLEARMDEVCQVLRLSEIECDLFTYALVRDRTCFDDFPTRRSRSRSVVTSLAMATDWPSSDVAAALSDAGRLKMFGILDGDGEIESGSAVSQYLNGGANMLEGQFYKKKPTDDALPPDYYGKLEKEHGGILRKLISAAKTGKRGANILFYGEPGTGKTSFAKTLAHELGLDLYEIRQGAKDRERDYSPESRLAGIRICNEQVPRGRSMILVDEADQLLRTSVNFFAAMSGGGRPSGTEKGVINTILDETRLPAIWISNTPACALDDSVRRRFDYSVRFERLGDLQRTTIWRNSIRKFGLEGLVPDELAGQFARKYQTSAGGIAMVLGNVKRMRPKKGRVAELVDSLMRPHCELMEARAKEDAILPAKDYSLEGLNIKGDIPLGRIVEAVRNFRNGSEDGRDPDRPRMNILLWGPPGTGKTEFVKHLGATLNSRVVVKMGSDLLSMWVGGTEKNIRMAFEEAESDNAILFLDEIDGLVQDRTGAQRSWEVTQVNELLHRMENFKGVMVGATNFLANLDAAIMRRFTFKLQFDYLDAAGKRLFFERMFRTTLSDADAMRLAGIPNLAPGDFRTVRQSLYYLGGEVSNSTRLSELEKESSFKKGAPARIGF